MSEVEREMKFDKDCTSIKLTIKEAIIALHEYSLNPVFDERKDWYKDRVFDAMKKLTQIKDSL